MKLSRYTKIIEDFPETNRHLLFNTLTHGVVVVDDEMAAEVRGLPDTRNLSSELKRLKKLRFLVADDTEDRKRINAYFADLTSASTCVNATVLTTYSCNFACTYCVEEGVISPVRMTREVAHRCGDFLLQQAKEYHSKSVYVSFYGGEPLMNTDAIRWVAHRVKKAAKRRHMRFAFSLVTNGALLTPEMVNELVELGLEGVKITLDGDRHHHDLKRPFKNGRGSFDVIMNNLRYAVTKVTVDVGGNFDAENVDSIYNLISYLKNEGFAGKLNRVNFKPISQTPKDREGLGPTAELECVYAGGDTAHTMVALRQELIKNGFDTDAGVGVNICGMTFDGPHFTVDPTGKLYKCPAFVGIDRFCVGDIDRGDQKPSPKDLWRKCQDCENVALCGDGCMYGAYISYGDETRLNCQRDYMETVFRENVKLEYQSLQNSDR